MYKKGEIVKGHVDVKVSGTFISEPISVEFIGKINDIVDDGKDTVYTMTPCVFKNMYGDWITISDLCAEYSQHIDGTVDSESFDVYNDTIKAGKATTASSYYKELAFFVKLKMQDLIL